MTEKEWQAELKVARDTWKADTAQALSLLEALARRVESEPSRDAGQWEREQTVGLKAALLSADASRQDEAASAHMDLAVLLRGQLRYYGRSVGVALANASLCLFKAGKHEEAFQAGEDALALLGLHGETSVLLEELVRRMRDFQLERHNQKKPSPSRRW